jgi:N-acetylglucosamine kinase-like BadF-type ATPase
MGFVLGVDAGGTKTLAVVADRTGRVHGIGRGANANFQSCGVDAAREQIRLALVQAAGMAGVDPAGFQAVCYGISGADRQVDFETVGAFTQDLAPCPVSRLENDTVIALRAGTPDGVGIALIAGTGSNAIGRSSEGTKLQVGGLGRLSGDFGSAGQLAEAAVVSAIMGQDGRAPATSLAGKIAGHLGLGDILDIVEYGFYDSGRPDLDLGALAPLVFEAASEGDPVAVSILHQAGEEIARAVEVILEKLFPGNEEVPVVFGGAIFQKGSHPELIQTVTRRCQTYRENVRFVRLQVQPVLGAVNFAFDDLEWPVTGEVWQRLRDDLDRLAPSG